MRRAVGLNSTGAAGTKAGAPCAALSDLPNLSGYY